MSDWSCRFIRDTGRDFLVLSRLGPRWRSRNVLIDHSIIRMISPMPRSCVSSMLTAVEVPVKISPQFAIKRCPVVHELDYPCMAANYTLMLPLVSPPCTLLISPVLQTSIQLPSFELFWDFNGSHEYTGIPLG